MWDFPGSGIESVSPAFAGGFFTTEPRGKLSGPFFDIEISEECFSDGGRRGFISHRHFLSFTGNCAVYPYIQGSLVAQMVKDLPIMQETWVRSLGWEDPRRRKWQPTPVFLPGESHGQRSLAGYSPWGCKELDTTERLTHIFTLIFF